MFSKINCLPRWCTYFSLLLIIVVSFWTRWESIGNKPYGFDGDEIGGIIANMADYYKIDSRDFGLYGIHYENIKIYPISSFINKVSFRLFDKEVTSPRKMVALISTFALIPFFFLCSYFFSTFVSFCLLILFSFSSFNLICSRISISPVMINFSIIPAMLCFCHSLKSKTIISILLSFLSGLFVLLALLTYNTAYLYPIIFPSAYLLVKKNAFFSKKKIVMIIFFLIPLVFFAKQIRTGFMSQYQNRKQVMNNMPTYNESLLVNIEKIFNSSKDMYRIFYKGMEYSNYDMLVNWPSTLINKIISFFAGIGLLISIIKYKKYLFLIIWFIFYPIIFHIILGFYLPRMLVSTSVLLYLLAGVLIEEIYLFSLKQGRLLGYPLNIFIMLLTVFVVLKDYSIFNNFAVKNYYFKEKDREILEILKNEKGKNYYLLMNNDNEINILRHIVLFDYLCQFDSHVIDKSIALSSVESKFLYLKDIMDYVNLTNTDIIFDNEDEKAVNNLLMSNMEYIKIRKEKYYQVISL